LISRDIRVNRPTLVTLLAISMHGGIDLHSTGKTSLNLTILEKTTKAGPTDLW
jgi:hypothetical protein